VTLLLHADQTSKRKRGRYGRVGDKQVRWGLAPGRHLVSARKASMTAHARDAGAGSGGELRYKELISSRDADDRRIS
jgi:hypothetical protein